MIFGIKTTKSIVKDLLKGMCPIYTSEDEQTLVEYMEDYFGTLYGKVTGNVRYILKICRGVKHPLL